MTLTYEEQKVTVKIMNEMCDSFWSILNKNKKELFLNCDSKKQIEKIEHLLGSTIVSMIGTTANMYTKHHSVYIGMTENITQYVNRVGKVIHDNMKEMDNIK